MWRTSPSVGDFADGLSPRRIEVDTRCDLQSVPSREKGRPDGNKSRDNADHACDRTQDDERVHSQIVLLTPDAGSRVRLSDDDFSGSREEQRPIKTRTVRAA